MIRTFLAALLATASFAAIGAAQAADLLIVEPEMVAPEALPTDWSGPYIGLHIGLGSGVMTGGEVVANAAPEALALIGLDDGEGGYELSGLLAGGQVGAMFQTGMFVLGVQGDVSWTNMTGDYTNGFDPPYSDDTMNLLWLANLTGRAGVAFDNVLVYALAGLAMAGAENDFEGEVAGATFSGYTVGLGGAIQLDDAWSLFAEAAYSKFGEETFEFDNPGDNITSDLAVATFKVGLNYSF